VEGQQQNWLHVAIDRFTEQAIDEQIEVVQGIARKRTKRS
jgi:hypothetical protein